MFIHRIGVIITESGRSGQRPKRSDPLCSVLFAYLRMSVEYTTNLKYNCYIL